MDIRAHGEVDLGAIDALNLCETEAILPSAKCMSGSREEEDNDGID